MLRFLTNAFVIAWLAFLSAVAIESHRDASLGGVQGLEASAKQPAPDLLDILEQSVWRRNTVLEIGEADVNRYLAATIAGKQHGVSATFARYSRVALSFDKDRCRAWFSWTSGGHRSTASVEFTVERQQNNFIIEPRGGSFGRLPLFRGALAVLVPGLRNLCGALEDEIRAVFQMNQIRFEKNKVVLDPRFETDK